MHFFNILEKNAAAAAMIFFQNLPLPHCCRDDFFQNVPRPRRHRHGGRGAAAVAATAAPPWTSLLCAYHVFSCVLFILMHLIYSAKLGEED